MRKWGTALVLVWLLIHPSIPPQFTEDESRSWTIMKRVWHLVWNRNEWVATSADDTKAECHARRDKAVEQALGKLTSDGRTLSSAEIEQWGAWAKAKCLPAEAVRLFYGSVSLDRGWR
jgi:hypothetical protein